MNTKNWLLFRVCTLAAVLVAVYVPTALAEDPVFTRTEDIIYGRKYGTALTMDVFTPTAHKNGSGVIWVVSGGWFSAKEAINEAFVDELTRRGYVVFAVVHGSQPKYTIPECIADIDRATRYIRFHAKRFEVDPDRLGIMGGSAGGHLSLMQATSGDQGDAASDDPVDRTSSRVQAACVFFPPTDFLNYGEAGRVVLGDGVLSNFRAPFDFQEHKSEVNEFVPVTDREARLKIGAEISPVTHVSQDDPPTLIIHGDADTLVPFQQAQEFKDQMAEAGCVCELIVRKDQGHGWQSLLEDLRIFADFFDANIGLAPAAEPTEPAAATEPAAPSAPK